MRKSYQQYVQDAKQPNADGTPSNQRVKTWEEFVREKSMHYPPDERQVFEEFMGGPTSESINRIKANRETTAAEHAMMDQMGLPGGPGNYSQVQTVPPPEMQGSPIEQAGTQNRIQSQVTLAQIDAIDQEPSSVAAMQANPQVAAVLINQLKQTLQKYVELQQNEVDPVQAKPELLDQINELRQRISLVKKPTDRPSGFSIGRPPLM